MNLTESIRHLMSEGKLEWTTTDDVTGGEADNRETDLTNKASGKSGRDGLDRVAKPHFPKLTATDQESTRKPNRVYYHGLMGSRLSEYLKTGNIPKAEQAFGGEYSITDDYETAQTYAQNGGKILVLKVDPNTEFTDRDPFEEESTSADIEDSGDSEFIVNNPGVVHVLGELSGNSKFATGDVPTDRELPEGASPANKESAKIREALNLPKREAPTRQSKDMVIADADARLEWTTTDDVTGAEEAALPDGAKFALHNIMGTLSLMYVGKDGKGNVIYRTPVGVPMAFKKAKQEAEKFLGIKDKDKKDDKKDDKKADKKEDEGVVVRVGPAEFGRSSWLTVQSDLKEAKTFKKGQTVTVAGCAGRFAAYNGKHGIVTDLTKDGKVDVELFDGPNVIFVKDHLLIESAEDLKSLQDLLNNPDEEFAKKNYGSIEAYKKMIQSKIDRLQKNEAITGAEQVTLKSTDKLEVKYGSVLVNGRPFDVTDPDESLDWPKSIDANGNLVTWFKGRASNANTWSPEEITGHYTDKHATVEEQPEISERYIQTVQLITKETDRSIIEAFLTKHSVAGRESNLLAINTEFKRFKKLHEAKI